MYPDSLKNLIESFQNFPGIGEKTAERMAFSVLNFDDDKFGILQENLKEVKKNIHRCKICNTLTDCEICPICDSDVREKKTLLIDEDSKIVFLFEKLGTYKGLYHVINGLISPLDNINPEDIGLNKLLDRVKNEKIEEVILALKPSVEGEITSLYIKKILDGMNIIVTRLASGVPIGADMEYIDTLTLERALEDRKQIA